MKYLINIMQCNTLSQQVRWLDDRGLCLQSLIKGSNFTSGVCMVNNGNLTKETLI